MPIRLISAIAVIEAVLLSGCVAPEAPIGALPVGMRTAPVPSVQANAYIYIRPPGNTSFSSDELAIDGLKLDSADILLANDSDSVALRFVSRMNTATNTPTNARGGWVDNDLSSLRFGPDSQWGDLVRNAWTHAPRKSFAEQFPGAWDDLQSMPSYPPAQPIAAGFVRNFGSLLERFIGEVDVAVPNLSSGLSLVRIKRISFVAYADEFSNLPERVEPSTLRDLDTSILAVAASTYPGPVVGRVFDGFASSLGLSPISVAGTIAHQRNLTNDIHVVVLRDSALLFFAIASNQERAIALIQAVITR